MRQRHLLRLLLTIVTATALAVPVALVTDGPGTPAIARDDMCHVTIVRTGGAFASLDRALRAAVAGDHLRLRGTCHGTVTIGRATTIRGVRPPGATRPTIDGDGRGPVVRVAVGATLVLRGILVTGGHAGTPGGGIRNAGTLGLIDSEVSGNSAPSGGGIATTWIAWMRGTSRIRSNEATGISGTGDGGGIWAPSGSVTIAGGSRVGGNVAAGDGGGLWLGEETWGTLIAGTAQIRGNRATDGGGVATVVGPLELGPDARIAANTVSGAGGGLAADRAELTGVVCAPDADANVTGNAPDECAIVPPTPEPSQTPAP